MARETIDIGGIDMEEWIEIRLWFNRFNYECYKRLLVSFVKPVVEELERTKSFETFHFFFEPRPHFLLRIKPTTKDDFEKIKALVKRCLKEVEDFVDIRPEHELFGDYLGEASDFGEDGWEITKKVFECGSRMAIAKVDEAFRKGKKFEERKLIHCFLNSLGYIFLDHDEADFHLDTFIRRMIISRRKNALDVEVEREIRGMIEERLNKMRGKKLEFT